MASLIRFLSSESPVRLLRFKAGRPATPGRLDRTDRRHRRSAGSLSPSSILEQIERTSDACREWEKSGPALGAVVRAASSWLWFSVRPSDPGRWLGLS